MRIITKRQKKKILFVALAVIVAAIITSVVLLRPHIDNAPVSYYDNREKIADDKIIDNESLYSDEDIDKVYRVYITVYNGADEKTGEIYNLERMNKQMLHQGDPTMSTSAYIIDPATGQCITGGQDGQINSTMQLRGQSTRNKDLKSYKLKFKDGFGTFRSQNTINLNKHQGDTTRVIQKFCFDMIQLFPNMVSLRTNFFRVYLKDAEKPELGYVDYGLYTHVEQPNKTFLSAHGLDPNGTLYKPLDYEFYYEEEMISHTSPDFDYNAFSKFLKIRENPANEKLAAMVQEINDENVEFEKVFEKYWDKDNYLTWCAMNLLLNNYDTMSRNYLLYSPSYSQKWYFLPWDYDASMVEFDTFFTKRSIARFFGIARYWGTAMHKRFFRNPDNVKLLNDKIEELYAIMMNSDIDSYSERYLKVSLENSFVGKDVMANGIEHRKVEEAVAEIRGFKSLITKYRNKYYEMNEAPMPIFLGNATENAPGDISFGWTPSYDLQADRIFYKVNVFTNLDAQDTSSVFSLETSLTTANLKKQLPDGKYFWNVIVYDSAGNSRTAFDRYVRYYPNGNKFVYFGIKEMEIKGGKLVADENDTDAIKGANLNDER